MQVYENPGQRGIVDFEVSRVITFFMTDTTGEMRRMIPPAAAIPDRYGHPYDIVYTNAVGTIVYEDDWQIAVRVDNGKTVQKLPRAGSGSLRSPRGRATY